MSNKDKGFASMPKREVEEIARKGGEAPHPHGRGLENADEETKERVARLGGEARSNLEGMMGKGDIGKQEVYTKENFGIADRIERAFEHKVHGEAALTNDLKHINFPITKQELLESVGNRDIQWFENAPRVKLHDIISKLKENKFSTMNELVEAVGKEVKVVK